MIGLKLTSDKVRNEVIRECCVKEDVMTKIKKNILRWFGNKSPNNNKYVSIDLLSFPFIHP
jgi:hypothetical protein